MMRGRTERDRGTLGEMRQRERRRLVRLGLSAVLFVVVYLGRGMLPQQTAIWRDVIQGDMDVSRSLSALERAVGLEGAPMEWLEEMRQRLLGDTDRNASSGQEEERRLHALRKMLPDYHSRPSALELKGLHKLHTEEILPAGGEEGAGADELPPEPQVVPAVAQSYTEDGRALPANVSLQYYHLGLEETELPVEGRVTSAFDFRDHPIREVYGFHTALDIGAPQGTEIRAFAAGVVEEVGENSAAGRYVWLAHGNGVRTFYAHCSQILARQGDEVDCGTPIALVGATGEATGPHLHFVLEKDGIRLNPALYLDVT